METQLEDVLLGRVSGQPAKLVEELEERGGSQFAAAANTGRWVMPWVGGWERIWTDNPVDASFLGGPSRDGFSDARRGGQFKQVSARTFVYGPGEGGMTVEYLHQAPGSPIKLLLTRQGTVNNLGAHLFSVNFPTPIDEYEVVAKTEETDKLATGRPLNTTASSGADRASPVEGLRMRTSYLSERLWIVRDVMGTDHVAVFRRTDTRSVMDRRGLVADGQLRPPEDESIRYGGLLFADTLEEYAGWEESQQKGEDLKDKLLRR